MKRRFVARKRTKRSYAYKRRRRGRQDISTRSLAAATFTGYGGRMLSKAAWRRKLWNDTLALQKFKTIFSANQNYATVATGAIEALYVTELMDNANPFWTAAGGLQPDLAGAGPPTLNPDKIVIRGGQIWMSFTLDPAATSDVEMTIQWVYPRQQTTRMNTATRTNIPLVDWVTNYQLLTPSLGFRAQNYGDYEQYFHPPIREKTIILKPGDSFKDAIRVRTKRIDAESFLSGFDAFPRIFIYMRNTYSIIAAQFVRAQNGYNLSFCQLNG